MAKSNSSAANKNDVRWFVWTIVFLVVVGVSLVSYIAFSDNGTNVGGYVNIPRQTALKK